MRLFEQRIHIDRMEQAVALFGSFDENVKQIEQEYHVTVVERNGELKVSGEPEDVSRAVRALNSLLSLLTRGEGLSVQPVRYCLVLANAGA